MRERESDFYKRIPNWIHPTKAFLDVVTAHLNKDSIVLDLGAGSGNTAEIPLKGRVKKVIGLDLVAEVMSNPYLDEAIIGSVYNIPLPDSSVDLVFSDHVMEHLEHPLEACQEVFRILKPQGHFVFRTTNVLSCFGLASRLAPISFKRWLKKSMFGVDDKDVFPTKYRLNTLYKIKAVLSKAGFSEERLFTNDTEPNYFVWSKIAFHLWLGIRNILNRVSFLHYFREVILADFVKL